MNKRNGARFAVTALGLMAASGRQVRIKEVKPRVPQYPFTEEEKEMIANLQGKEKKRVIKVLKEKYQRRVK